MGSDAEEQGRRRARGHDEHKDARDAVRRNADGKFDCVSGFSVGCWSCNSSSLWVFCHVASRLLRRRRVHHLRRAEASLSQTSRLFHSSCDPERPGMRRRWVPGARPKCPTNLKSVAPTPHDLKEAGTSNGSRRRRPPWLLLPTAVARCWPPPPLARGRNVALGRVSPVSVPWACGGVLLWLVARQLGAARGRGQATAAAAALGEVPCFRGGGGRGSRGGGERHWYGGQNLTTGGVGVARQHRPPACRPRWGWWWWWPVVFPRPPFC